MQPVLNTKKKQIEMWRDLILDYFRCNKLFELDINEPSPIFINTKINSLYYRFIFIFYLN